MLTITLPSLPPVELSPNYRGHWSARHRATRTAQDAVIAAVFEAAPRFATPLERAEITVRFLWPDSRRRDMDNFVARAKPYLDGLVVAGVLADDSTNHCRINYDAYQGEKGKPMTIITVRSQ